MLPVTLSVFGLWRVGFPPCLVRPGRRLPVQGLNVETRWPGSAGLCCSLFCTAIYKYSTYSTTPRNGNPVNGTHLEICLLSSRKNRNSLTWVLVALTVCFTYPVLFRVSAESRAGEWEL